MRNKVMLSILVLLLTELSIVNLLADSKDDDIAEITDVIQKSYFNGASNDMDTKSMREGFHPDFAIFSPDGNKLKKYPIAKWIESTENYKSSPKFDKEEAKADCKIVNLDVTGVCASAKTEEWHNGKLIYTDYLSLLKFKNGWKIVSKVYHKHE